MLNGSAWCTLEALRGFGYVKAGSISGNITGIRYRASHGSVITVNGGGANAIPGTTAGTADASSIYA